LGEGIDGHKAQPSRKAVTSKWHMYKILTIDGTTAADWQCRNDHDAAGSSAESASGNPNGAHISLTISVVVEL